MAHVKYNGMVALTNSTTGETMFIPVDGLDITSTLFEQIKNDPTSVTNISLRFKLDENNGTIRGYLTTS